MALRLNTLFLDGLSDFFSCSADEKRLETVFWISSWRVLDPLLLLLSEEIV